jgi:hypothetical protein
MNGRTLADSGVMVFEGWHPCLPLAHRWEKQTKKEKEKRQSRLFLAGLYASQAKCRKVVPTSRTARVCWKTNARTKKKEQKRFMLCDSTTCQEHAHYVA